MISLTPSVTVIILNWNGYDDTYECIESLQRITYKNCEILLIDNGSDTENILKLENKFEKIKIIRSKENLGYSGGNNIGINYALQQNADFILLLNNDTIVEPDFLNYLISEMLENTSVGITVPKINYYKNPELVWYAGGYISKIRGSGFTIGEGDLSKNHIKNKYVTFATGCCLLIKSDVIKDIHLLDENYFLYLEDVDYCMRCSLAGYKILFVARSKIYHKVSISSKKQNYLLPLYYVTRNRFYFVKKFNPRLFYLSFPIISLIFLVKCGFWILNGELEKIKVVKFSIKDFILKRMGKSTEL